MDLTEKIEEARKTLEEHRSLAQAAQRAVQAHSSEALRAAVRIEELEKIQEEMSGPVTTEPDLETT